jgi:quercetin 2,3-dioxygenase
MARSLFSQSDMDVSGGGRRDGWSPRRAEVAGTGPHGRVSKAVLVGRGREGAGSGPMITLRRNKQRRHVKRGEQDAWLTFSAEDRADPLAEGFGNLEILNEDRLPPGAGAGVPLHRHHDAEIVTYVYEGAVAYEDSTGRSGVIQAGEFQRMTAGRGIRHSESNASPTDWAHCFQMCLRPSQSGLAPSREQKRFSVAERRGALCVIASPDGRNGSLRLHQDAVIYSSLLDSGKHVAHQLTLGRCAWVHVVRGEVMLDEVVLSKGDGAGVTSDRAVSLTARSESEILLVDLSETPPRPERRPGHGLLT